MNAQIQCYCTGRGPDSASGHLWRMDAGCPRQPTSDYFTRAVEVAQRDRDNVLLADLLKIVVERGLLRMDLQFVPSETFILRARANDDPKGPPVALTPEQVEAIKRRFAQ